MYYLLMENHSYSYEIYEILNLYFPGEKITVCSTEDDVPLNCMLLKSKVSIDDNIFCYCSMNKVTNGDIEEVSSVSVCSHQKANLKKMVKHNIKLCIFKLLKKITKIEVPWGILVGIRPTKIVNELKEKNIPNQDIYNELKEKYLLTTDKIKLVMKVSENNYKLINRNKKNISIYIGIPFCPTRCVYCSFASYPICKYEGYVKEYIDALHYEIKTIGSFIGNNLIVDTIYVGGGTPTSIDDKCFKLLLEHIYDNFDIKSLKEFTVESGRPDTINSIKLELMKKYLVSRISINPQTMNAETLKRIGRDHSVEEIVEKYNLARDWGFDNINMDIIVGLLGEDARHLRNTLDKVLHLSPENITVHTMAIKRASRLNEKLVEKESIPIVGNDTVKNMMNLVYDKLYQNKYIPYYMYRQKMMVGNLENVGFCKPNFECLYNIQMIEEKQTIIGIGADAVTKLVFHDENRIERFANKKDIKGYINTIKETTNKKLGLLNMLT